MPVRPNPAPMTESATCHSSRRIDDINSWEELTTTAKIGEAHDLKRGPRRRAELPRSVVQATMWLYGRGNVALIHNKSGNPECNLMNKLAYAKAA